jgi:regulator of cell morphogenesis and NO signaling
MSQTCSCGPHGASTPASTQDIAGQTVAEVTKRPGALAVLQRLGIDHCCGAHLSLREAAAAAGVPLAQVLSALEEAGGTAA